MVFSEYKRRLISTHIYLSNVLLTKIWDFKIRSTRNLPYAQVVILSIFIICDIAKDSIGFINLEINLYIHLKM